jgi:oligoendopeptidase F
MRQVGTHAPDGNASVAPQAADLPAWDLTDLYPGQDSPELEADLQAAAAASRAFSAAHAGRLAALPGRGLAAAIAEYQRIDEVLGRIMSYAQLLFSGDSTSPEIGRFYQTMNERVTAISSDLLFFALELNRLDDAVLEQKLADPACAVWRPFLRSKNCCTRRRSPAAAPGAGCSTRPSPVCGSR